MRQIWNGETFARWRQWELSELERFFDVLHNLGAVRLLNVLSYSPKIVQVISCPLVGTKRFDCQKLAVGSAGEIKQCGQSSLVTHMVASLVH